MTDTAATAERLRGGPDVPVHVDYLFSPNIIQVKRWPRVWTFRCGSCKREMSRFGWFGWFGVVRCRFCRQVNAPHWEFGGVGY